MKTIESINLNNNRTYIFIHVALALFIFLCFRAGVDNFFAGDDFDWIFDAIRVMHRPSALITLQGHFIRPVTTLFFLINLLIAGSNPLGQHLTTILLHVLNVIFLSYILGRLCKNRLAGLLGALFWGVNYKHTEAVFLTYGVSDAFVLLFWLGTISLFLNNRKTLATGCFIISLFSKENAVLLPFLITLYVLLLIKQEKKVWLKRTIPLWIAAFLYVGFRNYVTAGDISYLTIDYWQALSRFWENLLSQIGPDATYIRLVWLAGQSSLLPGWIAVILFVMLGVAIWKIPREYRFGLLWMCITMLPTVFIIYQTSRYRYIPLIGLGLIVGQGVSEMLTYFRKKNSQKAILGICSVFTLVIVYFVLGVNLEEQDYAFFGEIHQQAAKSFKQDILPQMPKDTHAMAVFLKQDNSKWGTELYAQFLSKLWYFPGTYKWVYQRPFAVLGLASTYSFVSYCSYGHREHPLFASVSYEEFRKQILSGNFYIIIHDYETNTFRFGADSLKAEIVQHVNDKKFYYFLQPGRFDPTSTGAAYLSMDYS